jgi:hypothetical protein
MPRFAVSECGYLRAFERGEVHDAPTAGQSATGKLPAAIWSARGSACIFCPVHATTLQSVLSYSVCSQQIQRPPPK